jgi:hypothetical protein
MARHNREASGTDQRGYAYSINYPPDWLRHIKVTRDLETGRQSTKTLFRNPVGRGVQSPGEQRRLRIVSPEQGLEVEVIVGDPDRAVRTFTVTCVLDGHGGRPERVVFKVEGGLPLGRRAVR